MKPLPEDFVEMMEILNELRAHFPGLATPAWIELKARRLWVMEKSGATHFGSAAAAAWHVVQLARRGQSHLQVTSYISQLWIERMGATP